MQDAGTDLPAVQDIPIGLAAGNTRRACDNMAAVEVPAGR